MQITFRCPAAGSDRSTGYLKISHPTLYTMMERNEVSVAKVGGSFLFSPVALDEWVKKQREESIGV
jgi:excisionase family DNA binding protein